MRNFKPIFVIFLAASLGLGSYMFLTRSDEGSSVEQNQVVIYLVRSTPTDFYLVPVEREIKGPVGPASALQALLNGPLVHEELLAAVPPTTKLLDVVVHDGLATTNFSAEIVHDFNGGSLIESYLVKAIVNTLTEFPEIHRVQILIEGEVVESIGGHILITEPLQSSN